MLCAFVVYLVSRMNMSYDTYDMNTKENKEKSPGYVRTCVLLLLLYVEQQRVCVR